MSSGFVSGGTVDAPIERSDEWLEAQKELEANRAKKAEIARQTDGRSLYETLEANKAAKQDAFDEANRLKNQFRALDEDEIEFLDSVLESTRAEEDKIKRETAEGLALFRQQQDEADKKARGGDEDTKAEDVPTVVEESWAAGPKKRKRGKEKEGLKGLKIRRASTAEGSKSVQGSPSTKFDSSEVTEKVVDVKNELATNTKKIEGLKTPATSTKKIEDLAKTATSSTTKGGLVSYGSDDEDDW